MQTKHLTKQEVINKKNLEALIVTGRDDLSTPPNWLIDDIAIAEFNRLTLNLNDIDVIGNLDLNNICCYCNAYSLYRKITFDLSLTSLTIIKGNGDVVANPLIKLQQQTADEMRRFSSLFGLTIDSRLKLAVQKQSKETADIVNIFGDI